MRRISLLTRRTPLGSNTWRVLRPALDLERICGSERSIPDVGDDVAAGGAVGTEHRQAAVDGAVRDREVGATRSGTMRGWPSMVGVGSCRGGE